VALNKIVTSGCYNQPPLKESRPEIQSEELKRRNSIALLSRDYKRRLHGFENYNTRGSSGITATSKLIQLTTSLEIDENGDSGEVIGKRLSRTWRTPSRSRNKRLRTQTSRTLKPNYPENLNTFDGNQIPSAELHQHL
jgi:hypothetical protein